MTKFVTNTIIGPLLSSFNNKALYSSVVRVSRCGPSIKACMMYSVATIHCSGVLRFFPVSPTIYATSIWLGGVSMTFVAT